MSGSLDTLEHDLASVRSMWPDRLQPEAVAEHAVPARSYSIHDELERMSDATLVRTTDALARVVRDAEALLTRVAGEVSRRSPKELGKDGLAMKQGFRNAVSLVAASTGGTASSAARFVSVGSATAPRRSLGGERLPATHPHVSAALGRGALSIDAAAAITAMLDRVAPRAEHGLCDSVEHILVERAADVPFDLLNRMIREAEARLDQDGVEPREDALRADRSVSIRQERSGMIRLVARLDPESAAPVKGAIEAVVTHGIRTEGAGAVAFAPAVDGAHASGDGETGAVVADRRTIPQRQADALAMIAAHALGCSRVPSAPAATVVVRADLETLRAETGHGRFDGLDAPLGARTIRKIAASAGLVPAVFGADSVPLDLGRTARLFTWAQRVALRERDGGCACCGLDASYTQAHHIAWWERDTGPTDLANGVLLCPPCHTRIHRDGWEVRITGGQVWFVPPPHVDSERRPRLGGRERFALPRLDRARTAMA